MKPSPVLQAAKSEDFDLVLSLLHEGHRCDPETARLAELAEHEPVLRYLLESNQCIDIVLYYAVKIGDLDYMKWLKSLGYSFATDPERLDVPLIHVAIQYEHFHLLGWLKKKELLL